MLVGYLTLANHSTLLLRNFCFCGISDALRHHFPGPKGVYLVHFPNEIVEFPCKSDNVDTRIFVWFHYNKIQS